MKSELSKLQPTRLWEIFEEICQIPRASGKEEKILEYLKRFAKTHKLSYEQDDAGNLIIRKGAAASHEGLETVVLQSHVDMVCEKNSDVDHDFDRDPIQARVDGGWVKATGTTLGADDGVGIAAQLAILESDTITHGPLECLFTVEEETGLGGAFGLGKNFVKGRILLNLDSEDDGELFIGCAGGIDTTASLSFKKVPPGKDHLAFQISVTGLQGGHSGDDINKGRGNAVKMMNRMLWEAHRQCEMRLADIRGGNLRNAIARESFARVMVPARLKDEFLRNMNEWASLIKQEYKNSEPGLHIAVGEAETPEWLIDVDTQAKLLLSVYACPHGVMLMSSDIPGLVETSTNLASVSMMPDEIMVATSQRSAVESGKQDVAAMVSCVFQLAGADVRQGEGYPGWKPDMNSNILGIMKAAYEDLFNEQPKVLAIHAGLECGLIGEKYPGMDMISYGPTIKGAHSPDERIEINTVQKFWDLTLETLKRIPKAKH